MNTEKPYIVFSYGLMRYLHDLGFDFFATKTDKFNPAKVIFIYNTTDELKTAINNYCKNRKNN